MSLSDKMDQFLRDMDTRNKANIGTAATIYKQALSDVLSTPGDKDHPSKPGEAPHRVTGQLQASIVSQVDEGHLRANVGPTANYARFLQAKHPFLRLAYERAAAEMKRILLGR